MCHSHSGSRKVILTGIDAKSSRPAVVVGGRALSESLRRQIEFTAYCDNLQHLESLGRTLEKSVAPGDKRARSKESSSKKPRETS